MRLGALRTATSQPLPWAKKAVLQDHPGLDPEMFPRTRSFAEPVVAPDHSECMKYSEAPRPAEDTGDVTTAALGEAGVKLCGPERSEGHISFDFRVMRGRVLSGASRIQPAN